MATFIPNPLAGELAKIVAEPAIKGRAEEIKDLAASLAPVLTGALAASGRVEDAEDHGASVVFDVPYAAYVEHGTSDTAAQPFLRPAGESLT